MIFTLALTAALLAFSLWSEIAAHRRTRAILKQWEDFGFRDSLSPTGEVKGKGRGRKP